MLKVNILFSLSWESYFLTSSSLNLFLDSCARAGTECHDENGKLLADKDSCISHGCCFKNYKCWVPKGKGPQRNFFGDVTRYL